jgi:hypothetical protein
MTRGGTVYSTAQLDSRMLTPLDEDSALRTGIQAHRSAVGPDVMS